MKCCDRSFMQRLAEKRERARHLARLEMLINEMLDDEERGDEEQCPDHR